MSEYPKGVADVPDQAIVQVLMPRHLVRSFERRCLPIAAKLVGPVVFSEDDLPTFIIQIELHSEAPDG